MELVKKIPLIILFVLIVWLVVFVPIDTASTIKLFFICYGVSILLAIAFIYVDKKKEKPHGKKKIIFFSLIYGSVCFFLFWII